VAVLRGLLGEERIGHLGTLDPLATGVLPLALGSYSRLVEYFLVEDKRYLAEITFGFTTETGDLGGKVTAVGDSGDLSPGRVEKALPKYRGQVLQVPPAYSALKVGGRKMVDLAREGQAPVRKPREVSVYGLDLVGWKQARRPVGYFALTVGRGMYVRSFAMSLGEDMGCGATLTYLLRSRVGKFCLRDSMGVAQVREAKRLGHIERSLPVPRSVLPDFPTVTVRPEALPKIAHGVKITRRDLLEDVGQVLGKSPVMATSDSGAVVAVFRVGLSGEIDYEKALYRG